MGCHPKLIRSGRAPREGVEKLAELVPRRRAQLPHRGAHVMLDGATRDGEGHRDLGIAQPVARELNHFVLARRELAAVTPSSRSVRRDEAALDRKSTRLN